MVVPFPVTGPSHSSVILFHADTSTYVTAWWTKWEGAGPAKHYLNYFFNKAYSYTDKFPHPVQCMTVTNSCAGRAQEIVRDPKQVAEEKGWEWFIWNQYLLMPGVFIKSQALDSLTSYSTSTEVLQKSYL